MGRAKRADVAGAIYHMLNRANLRDQIFHKLHDYEAFKNAAPSSDRKIRNLTLQLLPDAKPLASRRPSKR